MPPKRKGPARASAVAAAKKLRAIEDDGNDDDEFLPAEEQKPNEVQFVHKPYKSNATFLSLIDDCVFSIFDRLSLNDLCSIAQTCKQLYRTSSEYFMQRHKSKVLIIENVSETGDLDTAPSEEYVDVFTTSMRNVTFGGQNASKAGVKRLTNFFRTNQMVPIKNLRLNWWKRGLTEDSGLKISNIVADVESFTLSNSNVVGDLDDCILRHMPKMNRLTLWKNSPYIGHMTYQWLQNPYPKLRYFAWHTDDDLPIDLLTEFFQINPIRFFSLQTKSQGKLQQLVEQDFRINELFFTVQKSSDFAVLQNLCEQQGTRLHLKFPDGPARKMLTQNMTQFTQLEPYIDGLYLEKNLISKALAETLTTFDSLKIVQVRFQQHAHILANAPSLREIYAYWGVDSTNFDGFRSTMMAYASGLPHLKRIYIRNNSTKFRNFKFDEFDEARKHFPGAGKLKIFVRTDELSAVGNLNDIRREYDTIRIERVESEEVKNPLVTEYLTGKKMTNDLYNKFMAKVNRSRWHSRWW